MPKGLNPNEYLKKYAQENNMDINGAMGALQSQFGAPQKLQATSVFSMANEGAGAIGNDFMSKPPMMKMNEDMMNAQMGQANAPNFMQSIMNFFKGNNPEQEGNIQGFKELTFVEAGKNQAIEAPPKNENMQGSQGQGDPDAYAKQYAEENNITLEEAKKQLRAMYGDPQKQM